MTRSIPVDVLVIGTGPIGATFARHLVANGRHVVMVEAGAHLSRRAGEHLKNAFVFQRNVDSFSHIVRGLLQPLSVPTGGATTSLDPYSYRPLRHDRGAHNPAQRPDRNLPGAAVCYAVGGMFTHWTNNTPRPFGSERIPFIDDSELDLLLDHAEKMLHTTTHLYDDSLRQRVILDRLQTSLAGLEPGRGVSPLPVAARKLGGSMNRNEFTGTDALLGRLAEGDHPGFALHAEHRATRLHWQHRRVTEVDVVDLSTGESKTFAPGTVIVCAGAVLTPQLLWKSGIRPPELGRHLTEHPIAFCQVVLTEAMVDAMRNAGGGQAGEGEIPIPHDDPPPMLCIPFSETRPWHSQVHRDSFSFGDVPDDVDDRLIVDLRWFGRVDVSRENRVAFEADLVDRFGMPQPTFDFRLSRDDRERAHRMMTDMVEVAQLLGGFLPGAEPRFMPLGTSLHMMGTHRMSPHEDDGVVDGFGRVWGFDNLYLGGNGNIPMSTACNPTLTSIALAIRSVSAILGLTPAQLG